MKKFGRKKALSPANKQVPEKNPLQTITSSWALLCSRLSAEETKGDYGAAEHGYREFLKVHPFHSHAWFSLGVSLWKQGKDGEAESCYLASIRLNPSVANVHHYLALLRDKQGRLDDALASYKDALEARPWYPNMLEELTAFKLMQLCRWGESVPLIERLREKFQQSDSSSSALDQSDANPFVMLAVGTSPKGQLHAARQHSRCQLASLGTRRPFDFSQRKTSGGRLRIGFLSSDLYEHATSYLMAAFFEQGDRSQFDFIAYSWGPNDGSPIRNRLEAAFDRFVDIRALSSEAAAELIHADGIDILVDLKGYTENNRNQILAFRPAPIQAQFLGFPGTMGTANVDYLIADPFVVPEADFQYYDEKIVHLPDCYQPNDPLRRIGRIPARAQVGLPETGTVFCSFNQTYKIAPPVFDIWMRILTAVPGSVLWILESNRWAKDNLRSEAEARGIDGARLIFAPQLPLAEHLGRFKLADIFLDTLHCNAHTTASDALWAGVPVLTCPGDTFASRVAGSLLHTMGMPELVMPDLVQYEKAAIALASDPERLAALRVKLLIKRETSALFDSVRFTRHMEKAFHMMWDRFGRGEKPGHLAVPRLEVSQPRVVPDCGVRRRNAQFPKDLSNTIPRIVHLVWVGDESKRPDNCISTWRERNPEWTVKLWGNEQFDQGDWINKASMQALAERGTWCGVADLLRYEILYREGGIAVDADSRCVRPLEDWLLNMESFACWESELARPGLIAVNALGACAGNPFYQKMISDIKRQRFNFDAPAWMTVGPQRITDSYRKHRYTNMTILPSHMFIPNHFDAPRYTGGGKVYAEQFWGSTFDSYAKLKDAAIQI